MTTTASDTPSTPSMDYRVVMRAPGEAEWTDVPARVLEEPVPWTEENAIAYIRKATDVPEGTKYQVLRVDCEADEWRRTVATCSRPAR